MAIDEKILIPLVDLQANYVSIKDEIDNAIKNVLCESTYIKGSHVNIFEKEFADYIGSNYCIGCANGTDAIELILQSLGIGPGDEVIVPALTWIATAEAVNNVGAEPVFADIKNDDLTIDPEQIENCITKKTKAIIPVHLYGCPCDIETIVKISKKYSIYVIEDCAQSHGAELNGQKAGSFGIASSFSFFPSKNLGAFGDAGAIVTNDPSVADKIRMIANHGQLNKRHEHKIIGRNSRLDSIQAAVLSVKLKYLDEWNQNRINAAKSYRKLIEDDKKISFQEFSNGKKHVFHIFAIRAKNRDIISSKLQNKGISTSIHYPRPLPFLDAYSYKGYSYDDFPIANHSTSTLLSLPMFPEITNKQIEQICNAIRSV